MKYFEDQYGALRARAGLRIVHKWATQIRTGVSTLLAKLAKRCSNKPFLVLRSMAPCG